jgi:hypothetical protein
MLSGTWSLSGRNVEQKMAVPVRNTSVMYLGRPSQFTDRAVLPYLQSLKFSINSYTYIIISSFPQACPMYRSYLVLLSNVAVEWLSLLLRIREVPV